MNWLDLEVILIACITACACVIPGIFLVLRGVALMTDAISHAVLLGIVILFLLVHDLHSPLLLLGAAASGVLTVLFTEWIIQTHCLKKDAAIGLIYPLFFSIGVILINYYARNAHLDLDMIFLGDLAYSPFNRIFIAGFDCGPVALLTMGSILCINTFFVILFYKELSVSIFDPTFATLISIQPTIIYYALMVLTSITVVGAFDVVGAVVVIALMITPPATALLLTDHLPKVISTSIVISIIASIFGYLSATFFDVSIAGAIATMSGICFLLALLFSPCKGLIAHRLWQRTQRIQILQHILFIFLQDKTSITIKNTAHQLGWRTQHLYKVLSTIKNRYPEVTIQNNTIVVKK